jgi:Domain of unknown function (DUF4260)
MQATALAPRSTIRRLAYATLALLLLASIAFEVGKHGTGYWQLALFGFGPDLALFYGAAAGLENGQLHPRAVRLYNLVHRFWLPLALMTLASFDLVPLGYFIGGLAWCFHISLDRALGYGLRTRDGFQRP